MILNFIAKVFEEGRELEQECYCMCGVTLIMSLLEHLGQGSPEVSQHIHAINKFYLDGFKETKELGY